MVKPVVCAAFIILTTPVEAKDLLDLAADYNAQKSQVADLEVKHRNLMGEVYEIERKTQKIVAEKADLDKKKTKLDHELSELSRQVLEYENQIKAMTPDLIERLGLIDQINSMPWFFAFLTSQSVDELDKVFQGAQAINESQAKEVANFVETLNNLEKKQQELKQTAVRIVGLKKNISAREAKIAKHQMQKKTFLNRVGSHLGKEKKKLKRLSQKGKRAAKKSEMAELAMLFGTDFFDKKGELPQPIDGRLIQEFGINKGLSRDRVQLMNKGHFYRASKESEVRSVSNGRVKFAGQLNGWGKVVVVDHGGRYYSTYSNLKSVKVKKGQVVAAKAVVGSTGNRHLQFGQGLYFEIRHFSEPQNPKQWLKPRSKSLARR